MKTKTRKVYIIQYRKALARWVDVKCKFNGKYIAEFKGCIGSKYRPSEKDLEEAKVSANDFAKENYRVIERTILWVDEK